MNDISPDGALQSTQVQAISEALCTARRENALLPEFPGPLTLSLEDAYDVQARSVAAWRDRIAGWKVGGVPPALRERYKASRLAGPIFSETVRHAPATGAVSVPAYRGSVAVEAEWVLELGDCSTIGDTELTEDDVLSVINAAYIGVELASSPIADINSLGSAVVVSDFGNNFGLIVGQRVDDWSADTINETVAAVAIDGETVGRTAPQPGLDGPLGAVKFLIEHLKAQGEQDLAGLLVSTGAITGVHDSRIGASSAVTFEGIGKIALDIVPIG